MKNLNKDQIINNINQIAIRQNFEWLNDYKNAKEHLIFKCKSTGIITKTNWSNMKRGNKIPLRNTNSYHQNKLESKCNKYNFTLLSNYVNYNTNITYKCNKCNTQYSRKECDIYKCGICNNFYKNNKGINKVNVLKNPFLPYKLYFVYLPLFNAYKIGLYKGKYVNSRFNTQVNILKVLDLPLYKAYYLEQFIIKKFKSNKYLGLKFGGYTEAFNTKINKNKVMEIMATSIKDVKPCELLETLEADNQQLSFVEIH